MIQSSRIERKIEGSVMHSKGNIIELTIYENTDKVVD